MSALSHNEPAPVALVRVPVPPTGPSDVSELAPMLKVTAWFNVIAPARVVLPLALLKFWPPLSTMSLVRMTDELKRLDEVMGKGISLRADEAEAALERAQQAHEPAAATRVIAPHVEGEREGKEAAP